MGNGLLHQSNATGRGGAFPARGQRGGIGLSDGGLKVDSSKAHKNRARSPKDVPFKFCERDQTRNGAPGWEALPKRSARPCRLVTAPAAIAVQVLRQSRAGVL